MENVLLSDGEWKLMNALWDNYPCSLAELVKILDSDTGWSKSTIFVMLKRLIAKNAVSIDTSGKTQLYSPIIKKEDATLKETKSFLSRVYGGSIGMMVSSMAGQRSLTDSDIDELRRIIEEMDNDRK